MKTLATVCRHVRVRILLKQLTGQRGSEEESELHIFYMSYFQNKPVREGRTLKKGRHNVSPRKEEEIRLDAIAAHALTMLHEIHSKKNPSEFALFAQRRIKHHISYLVGRMRRSRGNPEMPRTSHLYKTFAQDPGRKILS